MAEHVFDTTRNARCLAEPLAVRPILGIVLDDPEPLAEPELASAHDPAYVAAVRTGQPAYLAKSTTSRGI